jgi:universal stress protein A
LIKSASRLEKRFLFNEEQVAGMFDKVLVGVDLLAESAEVVLQRATELVGKDGEIFAVHIVEPQYVQYTIDPTFKGTLTRAMEDDAMSIAAARLAELCAPFGIAEDHQVVMLGRAADRIHELAAERGVDAIIVGSHARPGLKRLLGSTANAVLHNAPVNVMVIRIVGDEQ